MVFGDLQTERSRYSMILVFFIFIQFHSFGFSGNRKGKERLIVH